LAVSHRLAAERVNSLTQFVDITAMDSISRTAETLADDWDKRALAAYQNVRGCGLALVDSTFTVRWISDTFRRICGFDPVGMTVFDIIHPEDLEYVASIIPHHALPLTDDLASPRPPALADEFLPPTAHIRIATKSTPGSTNGSTNGSTEWKHFVASIQGMLDIDGVNAIALRFDHTRDLGSFGKAVHLLAEAAPIAEALAEISDYSILDGDPLSPPINAIIWWDIDGEHITTKSVPLEYLAALTDCSVYERHHVDTHDYTVDVADLKNGPRQAAIALGYKSVWVIPVTDVVGETLGVSLTWSSFPAGRALRPSMNLTIGAQLIKLALQEHQRRANLNTAVITDHLTNVLNRHGLSQRLRTLHDLHQFPVGALFIDVDDFKSVNDTYGHNTGDTVLSEISTRLSNACRNTDSVCRLGGDEFVIVCAGFEHSYEIEFIAQRILNDMAFPIEANGIRMTVTVSVGVSIAQDETELTTLIDRADVALYEAKRAGKATFAIDR
jgi:diguanylate cyclase (GGDEF)-like protein